MNQALNAIDPSATTNRCSTCGATSSAEAWNMCSAGSTAVCHGLTLFPVDVRIGRVECGAIGAKVDGSLLDSVQ